MDRVYDTYHQLVYVSNESKVNSIDLIYVCENVPLKKTSLKVKVD